MAIWRHGKSRFWHYSICVPGSKKRLKGSTCTENRAIALSIAAAIAMAQRREAPADRLHAMIDALAGERRAPEEVAGLPLDAVGAAYAAWAAGSGRNLARETVSRRGAICARLAAWAADHAPAVRFAGQVDRATAAAYVGSLAGKAKTRATIAAHLGAVWTALQRVRDDVPANPWPLVAPQANDGGRGQAFSPAQEAAVITAADAAGNGWGLACRIARHTGLRYGDIARLEWSAVDLAAGVISLAPSKTRRHGVRVVLPLAEPLRQALEAAQSAAGGARYVLPLHAAVYPRTHASNGPGLFSGVLAAAGVGAGWTFHSWRHTFRTRLAAAGVSDELAKRLGGWTEDATALRYDHDGRLAELRAAVDAAAGK